MRTHITAEIGINHSGSLETALKLIDVAVLAGADSVKFQKREPRLSVPLSQWDKVRNTPWGDMPYIEYKERLEFGQAAYRAIDEHCQQRGIPWFASAWDIPSVDFLATFGVPFIKVASASLTDDDLLRHIRGTGIPSILSTGMSTEEEIARAVAILQPYAILHCTSSYPCPTEDLNLRCIPCLKQKYPDAVIGFSDHSTGIPHSVAAVALGAEIIERHITLDRASWGTDQAASLEPGGLMQMVKYIRHLELSLGDGVKRVTGGELEVMEKLRLSTEARV